MIQKIQAYRKNFNGTKYMSYIIKKDELLEKFNKLWNKVSNTVKKGFDSEDL